VHFSARHGDDFEDGIVDFQLIRARRRIRDERPNAADDLSGASSILDDATNSLPNFSQVGRLHIEPA
jgi:hypothetical protein